MVSPVAHFEIGCENLEETVAFYQRVFGWDVSPGSDMSRTVESTGPGGMSGHFTSLGHEPHNYVNIYIRVEDVAASISAVTEAGGEAMIGPLPTPQGETFAWVKDPAGNTVGLLGP